MQYKSLFHGKNNYINSLSLMNYCCLKIIFNSADHKVVIYFFQKTGFDILCILSRYETICMKYLTGFALPIAIVAICAEK